MTNFFFIQNALLFLFIPLTFQGIAQEKIVLTTGDTVIGTLSKVDYNHSRITKSDSTSILILTNMVNKEAMNTSVSKEEIGQPLTHKFVIGINGGPGVSTLIGGYKFAKEFRDMIKPRFSYISGLYFQYNITHKFALCMETNFESKGYMIVMKDVSLIDPYGIGTEVYIGTLRVEHVLNYITTPMTAKFTFSRKRVNFYTNVGFYTAILAQAGWRFYPVQGAPEKIYYENLAHNHKISGGAITSLGINIPLKKRVTFSLELRQNTNLGNFARKFQNESLAILIRVAYKI